MDGMAQTPAHARPARRDHLWVLAVIAAFALFDVWGAWAQVGDKSGFAVGHTGTGWTLTVIVEAAAGYFLFAWFSAPGRRSRRCAMWSAFATLALSLIGQGASILAAKAQPPVWLSVFVRDLPVVALALIAVLIHMRRLDREEADEAQRAAAEAERAAREEAAATDERTALRAELKAQREALAAAQNDRDAAQQAAAETAANAARSAAEAAETIEALRRKLAAAAGRNRTRKPPARKGTGTSATKVPRDVDVQAQALAIITAEPDITGKELGERVGRSERWGQDFKKNLAAAAAPKGQDPEDS